MQIIAMGGHPDDVLVDYTLGHARGHRVLYVPTAGMEDPSYSLWWYGRLHGRAEMFHVHFFPWPPDDLRARVLESDSVLVAGGNTANMLAVWRVHGFDRILREAWEEGILLTGWSAGAICWFEAGVTDSFGPQLEGMHDGLGILPASSCPHYDGEELRRPRYTELVREGFPSGVAIDDDVAVLYEGTEIAEVVTTRRGARAYRVGPDGEEPVEARLLP